MFEPEQYHIRGTRAEAIAESVEEELRSGRLPPGSVLPTVRSLASRLKVSPATVAGAYRRLAERGIVSGRGRRGTVVTPRPPVAFPATADVPAHLHNLADGNPDPDLLPPWRPALARTAPRGPRLYGEGRDHPGLATLAARSLDRAGVPRGPLAVVGGALDGIERVLQAHLRPGDRVAVEDPGYAGVLDLVAALGFVVEPVPVDDTGPTPRGLVEALGAGVRAVVVTPRAQNPTGACLDEARAEDLRRILDRAPDVLLVEDDHAGPIAGQDLHSLAARRHRWAHVLSTSKWLGPDLRVALLRGDPATVARVQGRQALGAGWVSHVLQELAATLWGSAETEARLRRAAATYAERRGALIAALARRGVAARGRSGLNVWVPVPEEAAVVAGLTAAGWAVRPGERFRLRSAPGIRLTTARLGTIDAERLARDLAALLSHAGPPLP